MVAEGVDGEVDSDEVERYDLVCLGIRLSAYDNGAEKCFVTPSNPDTALTISGFYYVSLQRSDGEVEGLYYDPHSNPYQHLSLTPEKRTFPAYTFR